MTHEQKRKNAEVAVSLLCFTTVDAGVVPGEWLTREPELYINHESGHIGFKKSEFLKEDWKYLLHLLEDMKRHREKYQAEKKVLRATNLLERVVLSQKKHNARQQADEELLKGPGVDSPTGVFRKDKSQAETEPGEGISEPAIGPKPDAPPPAQPTKRKDAREVESWEMKPFMTGSSLDGHRLALCLCLTAEQEKLWRQWLQGLSATRKETIAPDAALTTLLEFGTIKLDVEKQFQESISTPWDKGAKQSIGTD